MSKKQSAIKVESIVLVIGDKEVKLSLDEARELMQILQDTLIDPDAPEVKQIINEHYHGFWPINPYPRIERWYITNTMSSYSNNAGTNPVGMLNVTPPSMPTGGANVLTVTLRNTDGS